MHLNTAPVRPSPVTQGWIEAQCAHCRSVILIREEAAYTPECTGCRRSHAENEARKLLADVNALIRGTGVFNVLSQADRQEQINQLGVMATAKLASDEAPAIGPALFVASESIPESVRAEVFDASSDADESPEYGDDFNGGTY